MTALRTDFKKWKYRAMIGTGGIGSGTFFAMNHNHTLGREESRSGHILDRKDYCKLHIISHYVKTLLGPDFTCIPVGKVGRDETGSRLIVEMAEAGLDTRRVSVCAEAQTLFSFCFLYPDGTGGNLTTDDSACDRVDVDTISAAQADFIRFAGAGVALAAPEVPLQAREKILDLGTRYHFFRAASFSSEEIREVIANGLLQKCDWLAMNLDEAASAAGVRPDPDHIEDIVRSAVERLARSNPRLMLSITAGRTGSWVWDGQSLEHRPALEVIPVGTAGAGDAHLSGILVGLTAGLMVSASHELGSLVAALSVTSPHTIDKSIKKDTLYHFVQRHNFRLSQAVQDLLSPDEA